MPTVVQAICIAAATSKEKVQCVQQQWYLFTAIFKSLARALVCVFECRLPELIVRARNAYVPMMCIYHSNNYINIHEISSHKRGVVNKSHTMIAFVINVNNDEYLVDTWYYLFIKFVFSYIHILYMYVI